MENRSLSVVAYLIVLLAAMPFVAQAAESVVNPELEAAWQARLDKGAAMQNEAKTRQAAADDLLKEKYAECATKFLINDCRNAADREHLKTRRETRRLEIDGKALERDVKKEQAAERERLRVEDAPRRAAEQELHLEEAMTARREAEDKAAATRTGKSIKAAEGEKRRIAEAEKNRKKRADHEVLVARKKQEAEQRAAKAAEKK